MPSPARTLWAIARHELTDSVRSRRVIVLILLYVAGSMAATLLFVNILQKIERQLAESLGVKAFGKPGSLLASAFLTSTLDQAQFKRTGFNGLMLPVLEDSGLASSASSGNLSVGDLLLFSSVCGAGLDVIPLPGETTADELTPILLDLAALSLRLNKALTARLMPIPGKVAGDLTEFNFEFFQNTRVLPLRSKALKGPLAGNENIAIGSRYENSGAQAG